MALIALTGPGARGRKIPRHQAREFVSTAAIDSRVASGVASGVDGNAVSVVALSQMFRQTVGYCAAILPGRSSGGVKSIIANFSPTIGTTGGCMH